MPDIPPPDEFTTGEIFRLVRYVDERMQEAESASLTDTDPAMVFLESLSSKLLRWLEAARGEPLSRRQGDEDVLAAFRDWLNTVPLGIANPEADRWMEEAWRTAYAQGKADGMRNAEQLKAADITAFANAIEAQGAAIGNPRRTSGRIV